MNKHLLPAFHLVARTDHGATPFAKHSHCQETWRRLQHAFPHCIAAVLMPNHLHLIVSASEAADSLAFRLSHCLPASQWQAVPAPRPIPDMHQLKRQIRYVHLNPCRKEYCTDPLAWEWSTHRDYMGAVAYPWPQTGFHLQAFGFMAGHRGVAAFHKYVSADPTVHPLGSPPPALKKIQIPHLLRLEEVCRAAELITRAPAGAFRRKGSKRARLMRLLSGPLGMSASKVSDYFGVHRSSSLATASESQHRINTLWLQPLLMVLEDQRLLHPAPVPGTQPMLRSGQPLTRNTHHERNIGWVRGSDQ